LGTSRKTNYKNLEYVNKKVLSMSAIDRFDSEFWSVWQNDEFKIFYPKDWVINEEPLMPIIKFQIEVPEDFDYYANVSVEVFEMNTKYSLNEQMKNLESNIPNLINGLDNFTIIKNTDEHISFLEVLYTGVIEGIIFQYSQYQWYICNKMITLTFLTEKDTVSDLSKTKELIFNNFKIK
jgi:hypothetical protein